MVNQAESAQKIRLKKYYESGLERLQNCTIYLHNGGSSRQIYIYEGSYVQQVGNWYDLAGLSTDYIAVTVSSNSAGTSEVYTYLEIVIPDLGVYLLYKVNFEIN